MNEERCENCLYLRRGQCHVRGPVALSIGQSAWPKTTPNEWCGEWARINVFVEDVVQVAAPIFPPKS